MTSIARLRLRSLPVCLFSSASASATLNPTSAAGDASTSEKPNPKAVLSLIRTEKDPDRILEICRVAALTPDSHLYRLAFSAAVSNLSASKSFAAVRSLIDGLLAPHPDGRSEQFRPQAIVLFGEAGMFEDAIRVFEAEAETIRPTVKSLNALLFACILAKRHGELQRIFRHYPKRYRIAPDLDTYNTLIKALCESGSSRSVYAVLQEMERKGIKPNGTSYNTFIDGLYREEKFEDVGLVLQLMKSNNCFPGISTHNAMIQGLCKLRRSREAKELLMKIKGRGMRPNSVTYRHLIHGFCREGDLEEAKALFSEMCSRGCVPDSECYFTLLHYLCQGGDFEEALKVFKQTMEKNWVPRFSTMKVLVDGLVSCSKIEEARDIVHTMKERFPSKSELWEKVEQSFV